MRILILKEKHSNVYYNASTPEILDKSARAILTNRLADGYWYSKEESKEIKEILQNPTSYSKTGKYPNTYRILEAFSVREYEGIELVEVITVE